MMKHVALVLTLALAGCLGTSSGFDGQAALERVEDIVYDGDALRVRSPGAPGHLDTAAWLQGQLVVDGWAVRVDSFNGSQYLALDLGTAARWGPDSWHCNEEDRQELDALQFANLYATKAGSGAGHVVLAAHWDAKEEASQDADGTRRMQPVPAANDGASGVAVLLQLQRELSGRSLPFDVTVALFDGEDGFEDCHPLAGSLWAARNGSLGDITSFVLLDMVGDPDAVFIRERASVGAAPALVELIWSIADARGMGDHFTDINRPITDDHVPFIEEGIQAVDIIDAGRDSTFPPYWHTSQDTPDKLSAGMLGDMGDLLLDLLGDERFLALQ